VLLDDATGTERVVATAKARTRRDLSVGIAEAIDRLLASRPTQASQIAQVSLVSLSTTLATNALVEGTGGRAALVFIGFGPGELERGGLGPALGDAPVLFVDGGHDSMGAERHPFDGTDLARRAAELDVDAFAVTGQFSVRNPAHELAARQALAATGKPVVCGHELSAGLNGPKRALTCLLNARLLGLIDELCRAAAQILSDRGIDAPLMVVRGDGSLVSAPFVRERPIETVLSGPAASMIGAAWLTGIDDLVVSDIGGTTTDVGLLVNGRPTVAAEGALVGGHRTMVEAVEMFTVGLGGDSHVTIDVRSATPSIVLGPRRVTPLAVLANDHRDLVVSVLGGRRFPFRDHDVTFIRLIGAPHPADGPVVERLAAETGGLHDGWMPLDRVATTGLAASAARSLVAKGQAELAAFTPTDAAHVLGLMSGGDTEAATAAAELMAAAPGAGGEPVSPDGRAFARWVVDTVIHRSAETVLRAAVTADGLAATTIDGELVQRALRQERGATALTIAPTARLAAIGASAATYYPGVGQRLATDCIVPDHAEVANAVGAAVGQVRVSRTVTVSQPSRGQYRVHHQLAGDDLGNLEPAIELAVQLIEAEARTDAAAAGATVNAIDVATDVQRRTAMVNGRELFVEAAVTAVASGPPATVDANPTAVR
jgi:N-methylhydantoinase A/oxoprolinase/acetone carboxylase beta subunit